MSDANHILAQYYGMDPSLFGMVDPGNIDLAKRPVVRNPDGSISTVRSMSANIDGREVLMSTISDDGRGLSPSEAIDQYRQTGRHLGTFDTPDAATAYAQALHAQQERAYVPSRAEGGPVASNDILQQHYGSPSESSGGILDNAYGYGNPGQRFNNATQMAISEANRQPQPTAWAQAHPTLAAFLSQALTYAPMALPAFRGTIGGGTKLPPRWEDTYHGTGDPQFQLQDRPIWSSSDPKVARFFARESSGPGDDGAIAPLRVDTADYVTVRPGSALERFDNKLGSANELYNEGRNWLGDILQLLGKKGLRYEGMKRDFRQPVTLSLDPTTVHSRYGEPPAYDPLGDWAKLPASPEVPSEPAAPVSAPWPGNSRMRVRPQQWRRGREE